MHIDIGCVRFVSVSARGLPKLRCVYNGWRVFIMTIICFCLSLDTKHDGIFSFSNSKVWFYANDAASMQVEALNSFECQLSSRL
ncbi:Uncharacterized protein APZ42_016858 [Daphnia magna]|uniref:Uncharacterized protein n=1 Tax=Daphnia magna TaxID=35525 RepID=A0A165A6P6_9CRUS|nr:Uncharacterized protein APZ42_016858 [Daphnia magna]